MKIVKMAVLTVLSALAMNCGDKPPQDPTTVVEQDAAAPTTTDPAPAPTTK